MTISTWNQLVGEIAKVVEKLANEKLPELRSRAGQGNTRWQSIDSVKYENRGQLIAMLIMENFDLDSDIEFDQPHEFISQYI